MVYIGQTETMTPSSIPKAGRIFLTELGAKDTFQELVKRVRAQQNVRGKLVNIQFYSPMKPDYRL